MILAIQGNMSMSEIQANFPKLSSRTIIRKVNDLFDTGQINHGRIHGKGKHKRYFITEENTKNNLLIRAFKIKGKNYKEVRPPITQRELSHIITERIQHYKNELKKRKFKTMQEYVFYHIAIISGCLEWMTQITWAIHSGMLGDSQNKLQLAYRNRERFEEFLQQVIYNLKQVDEKIMNAVTKAVYHALIDNYILSDLTMGYDKGKISLQINKNKKK